MRSHLIRRAIYPLLEAGSSCIPSQASRKFSSAIAVSNNVELPPANLYVNPICMQMDKMILKAATPEDVLTILVTHRGALFVQNLVTAMVLLADMSSRQVPFSVSQKMRFPEQYEEVQKDKLLADPRYSLLISDLIEYSSKMDIRSIQTIMESLQSLNHCHYKLFGALLRRLYSMDIPESEISAAISIGSSLEWGGFGQAETFFNRLSDLLIPNMQSLSSLDFINAVVIYSKLPKLYPDLLNHFAESAIPRLDTFSNQHIGFISLALTVYGGENFPTVRLATIRAADILSGSRELAPELRDLVRVAVSLRRTNVCHEKFLKYAIDQSVKQFDIAATQRERMDPSIATISDLAQLMDTCAHFGISSPGLISSKILPHIQDNVDVVTEESAIRILYSLARFPSELSPSSFPITNLLIRKIGGTSSTCWEKHKMKLMFIWFSKCMQFPTSIDSEIRKFILDKCLNHYLIARRGYTVPFPEDSEILWTQLKDAGLVSETTQFNAYIPNSPFNADILIPEHRLAILVLSQFDARDPMRPVGTDALQCELIRSLGWEVYPIDRKCIRKKDEKILNTIRKLVDS